jgi:hypothetical protein
MRTTASRLAAAALPVGSSPHGLAALDVSGDATAWSSSVP